MTIRKGEPWGSEVRRPAGLLVVDSDAALAHVLADETPPPVAIRGGDLFRTLGSPGARDVMQRLPIDLLRVVADGRHHTAVAHVVARRGWLRGPVVAIMNVGSRGEWNVAPRAHPNDGRFDVVDVDPAMRMRERWSARRRLPTGTHLPHPAISTSSSTRFERRFDRPMRVEIDGITVGGVRELVVEIDPDAGIVLA
ncbi:MAG: hypothetical protein QNJ12_21930 [Ilumatobacter sp.]|uniref:hypothetical protein n=1 Tax=Ilumatobacter sp. TaxID=1967498 RepID=UPI002624F2CB|nr:hypothetical protein [Ilumatobacter sp.]MDJ0771461.1 hypothetical protein [Ilumatobacter sp.]